MKNLQRCPARKGEIAGDDAGAGPEFRLQFFSQALHHIGEEITEDDIRLIETGLPEIGITDFNAAHSQRPEPGQEVSQRVHLETQSPDAVAPLGASKDPPVPAADVHKPFAGGHGNAVENGFHPDRRRGVKHSAAGDVKDRDDGGREEELGGDKASDQNQGDENPGRHAVLLVQTINHFQKPVNEQASGIGRQASEKSSIRGWKR